MAGGHDLFEMILFEHSRSAEESDEVEIHSLVMLASPMEVSADAGSDLIEDVGSDLIDESTINDLEETLFLSENRLRMDAERDMIAGFIFVQLALLFISLYYLCLLSDNIRYVL